MTYTVLIVDDESTIREGLKHLIGTMERWECVGEADNGVKAVEQIIRRKPDLVLSDIRMPEMDGLKLLEHLSNMPVETIVIFLTGYPDFEYAQTAIRYGAFDYLLKPMRARDIAEVIRKAERRIEEHRAVRQQSLQLEQVSADLSQSTAERLIREMLYDGNMEHLKWINHSFFSLHNKISVITVHGLSDGSRNLQEEQLSGIWPESSLVLKDGREEWVILLGWTEEESVSIADKVQAYIDMLSRTLSGLFLKIGIGSIVPLSKAGLSYDQSKFAAYLASSERKIVSYCDISGADDNLLLHPIELELALLRSVKNGNVELALQLLEQLEQNYRGMAQKQLAKHALQLHIHLQSALAQLGEGALESWPLPEAMPADNSQIIAQLAEGISYCASRIREHNDQQLNYVIQRVKAIVREDYGTELKLGEIAGRLGMNASYLSTLFKQETGMSFSDYLSRYRIDRSMQLLREPDLKIYEVAQRVGYTDGRHYSQLFRKAYGMTPFEFRNRNAPAAGEYESD